MMIAPADRIARYVLLPIASAITLLVTDPSRAADTVCVYQSKSYSEGAFICVQKSLMQSCSAEGGRMVWRVVTDKDIGDRCVEAIPSAEVRKHDVRKRIVRRTRLARQTAAPSPQNAAKCFVFNGKRYCE